jgi:Recombination endonuclease VII
MNSDVAVDRRLKKVYGISLSEYEMLLEEQEGVCAVCGAPPKTRRLHVDHDHKVAAMKLENVHKLPITGKWTGEIPHFGVNFVCETKKQLYKEARHFLQRKSIRGLLCHRCNRGLQAFQDSHIRLSRASAYVAAFRNQPKF